MGGRFSKCKLKSKVTAPENPDSFYEDSPSSDTSNPSTSLKEESVVDTKIVWETPTVFLEKEESITGDDHGEKGKKGVVLIPEYLSWRKSPDHSVEISASILPDDNVFPRFTSLLGKKLNISSDLARLLLCTLLSKVPREKRTYTLADTKIIWRHLLTLIFNALQPYRVDADGVKRLEDMREHIIEKILQKLEKKISGTPTEQLGIMLDFKNLTFNKIFTRILRKIFRKYLSTSFGVKMEIVMITVVVVVTSCLIILF